MVLLDRFAHRRFALVCHRALSLRSLTCGGVLPRGALRALSEARGQQKAERVSGRRVIPRSTSLAEQTAGLPFVLTSFSRSAGRAVGQLIVIRGCCGAVSIVAPSRTILAGRRRTVWRGGRIPARAARDTARLSRVGILPSNTSGAIVLGIVACVRNTIVANYFTTRTGSTETGIFKRVRS